MSASLHSERDVAKYFSLSGVSIRPEACASLVQKLLKLEYYEHKRAYIDKFMKKLKERQVLVIGLQNSVNGNGVFILD